ncbi:MAG: peptidyl-prolyl cis-trans isomerase [Alphaproteobacteria bacterium]
MLQSMRHLAQTSIFKGFMLILVGTFALWGIGDIFRGNPLERTVAKAGNISINVKTLNQVFEVELGRARQTVGPDLTAQQAKQMGVLDKSLEGLINRAEVDQALKKLNVEVSGKTVMDQVAAQPQFRDKSGQFNKAMFRQLLDQARLSEAMFIQQGREDLARRQIIEIFANVSKPTDVALNAVYKARGQQRIVELVTVKNASMTGIPTPTDAELQDFYKQNPQPFTAPEYRTLTLARLSADDILKDVVISDDDVRKEYDAKIAQITQPERRDILQVVIQDENKAKELTAAAQKNGNLTTAAINMGYNVIPLDQTQKKTLLAELVDTVFNMKPNDVSNPIKSGLGWHVVQLKKITPEGRPEFKDIKDKLRTTMQRDHAIENVTRTVNLLDDKLAAGHALEDIADELRLRLIKIQPITAQGKTVEGKDPSELPNKEDVLKIGFTQNPGEVSPIIDDKNGNYLVIRTDDATPSALKPYDQVKNEVIEAWKVQQQAKQAVTLAEKVAQAIREGKSPTSFAGQNGIEVRTSKPISMLGDSDPALPPTALPQIFKLKKGEVAIVPLQTQQLIVRLDSLKDIDPTKNDDNKLKIGEELKKDLPNELTEEYLKYLEILFPVTINRDVLEAVRRQGTEF